MNRQKIYNIALIGLVFATLNLGAAGAQTPAPANTNATRTIADYKKEIGLSDKQLQDIVAVLSSFKQTVDAGQKQLLEAENDYTRAIEAHADLPTLKAKLQKIADLRVQIRLMDVETSRKIEAIMTPAQLASWRAIQARARSGK